MGGAALADRFPTTRWSRVLAARDGRDTLARDALETLCQVYWHPLYAFVRRQGYDADESLDLVQAYFAELLEKEFLGDVEPVRGRFRSFLLASLKHFLSHERDRARALKRGGHMRGISIDATAYDEGPGVQLADDLTPEEVYERQWALTVLERALERVRQDARQSGRSARFEALKPHLTGEGGTPYAELARQLETNESSVRGMVLRLRKRLGSALRAEIADTVSDPAEVDDEIRRLLSMIRLS